jgi:hypothetical protein
MGWDNRIPWDLLLFFFDRNSFVFHSAVLFFHRKTFDIFFQRVETMKTQSDYVEFSVLQAHLNF